MSTEITVQQWLNRGYRRYEINDNQREIHKLAHFMLQKRFDDDIGKKYFITVYCYDRNRYPYHMIKHIKNIPPIGYMPSVNFNLGDNQPFFNIEINSIMSIDQVEQYFEKFWNLLEHPYYEKFEVEV